ncbi:MAG: methionine synthase [Bacteroidaceae bacterium]|nr:methionine synthase [Bacteroidaceae bacterium]
MFCKKLEYKDLGVTLPEIYEQMGYGDATNPDIDSNVCDDVRKEVDAVLSEVADFLEPELCFYLTKGELAEEDGGRYTLTTNGKTFDIGKIIYRQLKGSSLFAFFVCSAGMKFQEYQERLKAEDDMMKEFTANAIGSVLAEKTADIMERELEALVQPTNMFHTNRFSPGYCGWHVREQKLLFSTFPIDNPSGVQLTESCLMMPIKSVSGVVGVGQSVRKLEYTCGLCDFANCYKRRIQKKKIFTKSKNLKTPIV